MRLRLRGSAARAPLEQLCAYGWHHTAARVAMHSVRSSGARGRRSLNKVRSHMDAQSAGMSALLSSGHVSHSDIEVRVDARVHVVQADSAPHRPPVSSTSAAPTSATAKGDLVPTRARAP